MTNELKKIQKIQRKILKYYSNTSSSIECFDSGVYQHIDFKCLRWVDGVISSTAQVRIKSGDDVGSVVWSTLEPLGIFEVSK